MYLVGVSLVAAGGCAALHAGGRATVRSMGSGATLTPAFSTRVYSSADTSTADLYLTDLPESAWNADPASLTGTIVHVHMFITPKAGQTPIAGTASTAVVRCAVLAKGQVGIYGGGGFFVNSGRPGGKTFGGGIRRGSLRLLRSSPGFQDLLGPSEISGSFEAVKDPEAVHTLERLFRATMSRADPLPPVDQTSTPTEAMSDPAAPR
jgi:hypothetical protein